MAVLDPAAQGIATDQDGDDPEDDEVHDAGVEDGSQDALAPWSHGQLSEVWVVVVSYFGRGEVGLWFCVKSMTSCLRW